MAKKTIKATENVGFNMTPMIDVVFQLIIFFMLATEFVAKDLEAVKLPVAEHAVEDKNPPERMIINICHSLPKGKSDVCEAWNKKQVCMNNEHWRIRIKSKDFNTDEALNSVIRAYASDAKIKGTDIIKPSEKFVQIRGDRKAPGSFFKRVLMRLCLNGIYKIELGAAKPKK